MTEKGIVNGASFNYGTDGPRHWDLDVDPISRHDPQFRRDTLKGFRSPKRVFRQWFRAQKDDFMFSYFNAKGLLLTTTRVVLPESKNLLSNSNVKFIL